MTNQTSEGSVQITRLPNGIRIVSECVTHVQSVSIGLFVGIGSRHEPSKVGGICHFIEHMLFKGTARRDARQIADEIESRGGHLNAFTDKETTVYQARVLAEHMGLAIDVLTDMLRGSLLDTAEIEREKGVVLEEIKMIDDTPEDKVHDLFEETLWAKHPVGRPIIGTAKSVAKLSRETVVDFLESMYRPDRIVISAAGNIRHEELVAEVERALGDMAGSAVTPGAPFPKPSGKSLQKPKRDIEQVHFVLGTAAYGKLDRERYSLSILNNVLGGNMSSRLFQEVREKRGLAYAIGSYGRTYQDGGYFCVYGGTSPENFEQVLELTRTEFERVSRDGLGDEELAKAKTQVRGALVLGLESMSSRMSRYGEAVLGYDRVVPLTEVLFEYEAVSAHSISQVASRVLNQDALTLAAIGPFAGRATE